MVIRLMAYVGMLVLLSACGGPRYYENLPPPRTGVLAFHDSTDPDGSRPALIARRLLASRPIPVDRVLIFTSNYKNPSTGKALYAVEDNAGANRCGKGNPPTDGCIFVGMKLIRELSDDALAGVLSHELGHLERGHIGSRAVQTALGVAQMSSSLCQPQADPRAQMVVCGLSLIFMGGGYYAAAQHASMDRGVEQEADQLAWERLSDAGYCAGSVMKTTFTELSILAPKGGKGDIFSTHPSYSERWANANSSCGNVAPVGKTVEKQDHLPEKQKPIEEARVRPYEAPGQTGREIIGKDGAPMVLVPAGEFLYGEKNQRMTLPAFYMDLYELTTSRYAKFLQETGHGSPNYWGKVNPVSHAELPVVGVEWVDADAYCRWAGKRLPTEAEWEKAARGTDGRTYPWGDAAPSDGLANWSQTTCGFFCNAYEERLTPVNSYKEGRSPYGIYNMAGNVWEWVNEEKGIRGGSWNIMHRFGLRSWNRAPKTSTFGFFDMIGFRCAQDAR